MNARTRLLLSIGIPLLVLLVVVGLYLAQQQRSNVPAQPTTKQPLTTMKLALDWTPNTNHTGVYVAMSKKWYQEQGINLQIVPYSSNVTPDVLVSNGKADVGVSSTESVVSDAAVGQPTVSIAAIVQHNTSALAALSSSGIKRPRDLDGKTYGAFGAPYEAAVISQIIKHDGGKGNIKSITLDIDPLQALQSHHVDFVWIFEGAEGIQAKHQGMPLNTFPIINYGIADYYTPTFIASPNEIKVKPDLLHRFMKATAQGYEYARTHASEAAQIMMQETPKGTFPDLSYVQDSQQFLSEHYADNGRRWGLQDAAAWHGYPQFILKAGGVKDANGKDVTSLNLNALYTNQFLP
ncbi:ABC transporter substrate-binding protein [Dictyobacter formicarum]|uniref:Thiamine pyrimidine synthase n=1 Tax=Dictyobacter formicarum TaxID=2778368 RepID=A0ABQ3VDQ2_9CHLR|nr:ABC transporter substrate-binding protein [Dictyobacter formicarum]GHO83841.1 nitrate ABC transporter substrate-binding protein [Dictyobacter formicarum]